MVLNDWSFFVTHSTLNLCTESSVSSSSSTAVSSSFTTTVIQFESTCVQVIVVAFSDVVLFYVQLLLLTAFNNIVETLVAYIIEPFHWMQFLSLCKDLMRLLFVDATSASANSFSIAPTASLTARASSWSSIPEAWSSSGAAMHVAAVTSLTHLEKSFGVIQRKLSKAWQF